IGHSQDAVSGEYLLGPDGRGTITLNIANLNVGVGGTEKLSVAVVSSSRALIAQFDSSAATTGSMDLQTLTSFNNSAVTGGFAFTVSGQGLNTVSVMGAQSFTHQPFVLGGILNVDSPGAISGTGSVVDSNDNGVTNLAQSVTGTISTPDA